MASDIGHRVVAKVLVFVAAGFACAGAIVCLRAAWMWRAQAWGEVGISVALAVLAWTVAVLLFRHSLRVERPSGSDALQARLDAAQQRLARVQAPAVPEELEAEDPEVAALMFAQADLTYRETTRRRQSRWVTGLLGGVIVAIAAGIFWLLVRVATG